MRLKDENDFKMISVYRKEKYYIIVEKRGLKRWTEKEGILGGQK
jgi:hypothetical protein